MSSSPANISISCYLGAARQQTGRRTSMLSSSHFGRRLLPALLLSLFAAGASAQSFRVQCPPGTKSHPAVVPNTSYSTFTQLGRTDGKLNPTPAMANPGIKCQQISGGDGFVTMGDGVQTYLFGFGPLSGLADMARGRPGTQRALDFNLSNLDFSDSLYIGAPVDQTSQTVPTTYTFNGAVGLVPDVEANNGTGTAGAPLTGHVDPRLIMDVGVMNANQPAPMMAIDEDDEFFLTLTNVGQVMRPDLFEQHTVHFHGYPNASAFYDGVPDASIAINIGGSFTYYYLAPDAGTYFWHCHISPPEHLQMGMVGQIYVRPRQNRVPLGHSLYASLAGGSGLLGADASGQQSDLRTKCGTDILCATPLPPANLVVQTTNPRT